MPRPRMFRQPVLFHMWMEAEEKDRLYEKAYELGMDASSLVRTIIREIVQATAKDFPTLKHEVKKPILESIFKKHQIPMR